MTWINFWESESRWDHIDVAKQSNAQAKTCECEVFSQDPHLERLQAWGPWAKRTNKGLGQWSGELTTEQKNHRTAGPLRPSLPTPHTEQLFILSWSTNDCIVKKVRSSWREWELGWRQKEVLSSLGFRASTMDINPSPLWSGILPPGKALLPWAVVMVLNLLAKWRLDWQSHPLTQGYNQLSHSENGLLSKHTYWWNPLNQPIFINIVLSTYE